LRSHFQWYNPDAEKIQLENIHGEKYFLFLIYFFILKYILALACTRKFDMKKSMFLLFIFIYGTISLLGTVVEFSNEKGEMVTLNVEESESFFEVADKIASLFPNEESKYFAFSLPQKEKQSLAKISLWDIFAAAKPHPGGYLGYPRDYNQPIDEEEKSHISFIVNTLGFHSLSTILKQKGRLHEVGYLIDHIHPLRFLECIFTDEKLKAGIRNIRGRGWIWGDFIAGIKESLTTESELSNVEGFISDFASRINISVDVITPFVTAKNWDKFVDTLIATIPRKGDQDRYDN
jgi:hypothetical protein